MAGSDKRPRPVIGEVDPSKAERRTPFLVKQYVVNPVPKSKDGTATVENISQVRAPGVGVRGKRSCVAWTNAREM